MSKRKRENSTEKRIAKEEDKAKGLIINLG